MDIRSITSAAGGYAAARPATQVDPEFNGNSPTDQLRSSFASFASFARFACARHGIAVKTGRNSARDPWRVEQNRGRRARC